MNSFTMKKQTRVQELEKTQRPHVCRTCKIAFHLVDVFCLDCSLSNKDQFRPNVCSTLRCRECLQKQLELMQKPGYVLSQLDKNFPSKSPQHSS